MMRFSLAHDLFGKSLHTFRIMRTPKKRAVPARSLALKKAV
jgi:hypothetical protein